MLDHRPETCETALLVRPIPRVMATGAEPIRFGGKPRLPDALDWPVGERGEPQYFFAEIDLARLPRPADLPDLPATGTLFLFLPLAHDHLYQAQTATVLYTTEAVSTLPERDPPRDLPDLRDCDPRFVDPDGTDENGTVLVPQQAEVLPFQSARAVNPLLVNMSEVEGPDAEAWRKAHRDHQTALEAAFGSARPMPPNSAHGTAPEGFEDVKQKVPEDIRSFSWAFEGHHLDWEFIWDWSQGFYTNCYGILLEYLGEMQQAGVQPRPVARKIDKTKAARKAHKKQRFGTGRKPLFFNFSSPVAIKETFDWQARRWMALSRFETGHPPTQMRDAFCAMLDEIVRHYGETDDEGYNLGPRIGLIDHKIKGHDRHAGNTLVAAKRAFQRAVERAVARHEIRFDALDQATRWDSRVIEAGRPRHDAGFSLGIMPLQMFGLGFEIQSAVTDHAGHILLFQIGDAFGLPIDGIGPDMIVQLWIKPEDLAAGRFDAVEMTMDMT